MRGFLTVLITLFFSSLFSQDSTYIKVHFLYGSKPLAHYKTTGSNWFGGIWGGHVGLEIDSGDILNFLPSGGLHKKADPNDFHSKFAIYSEYKFYSVLGKCSGDSAKSAVFIIPVTQYQKKKLDSIAAYYVMKPPYDYAFWGMRCGAAAYEILAQIEILPSYPINKTFRKIFYPKRLRKKLFKLASVNGWKVKITEGTITRKWEKD